MDAEWWMGWLDQVGAISDTLPFKSEAATGKLPAEPAKQAPGADINEGPCCKPQDSLNEDRGIEATCCGDRSAAVTRR